MSGMTLESVKENFRQFVDFEFLMAREIKWALGGTDQSISVGLRKILRRKVVENGVQKTPTYQFIARKCS